MLSFKNLEPTLDCLADEIVLIQAWKKVSAYIRYHNWFSDTLELDRTAIDLPKFIASLSERIKSPEGAVTEPLRIVPAPKSQHWRVRNGKWGPEKVQKTDSRIRPLAHVSLSDQVIGCAVMMCLANRVETIQGDPSVSLKSDSLQTMVSYGNRLFSDYQDEKAHHRWGSSTIYRGFYKDYQSFLARPEKVAERIDISKQNVFIIQADLRQFYDRVTPPLLEEQLLTIQRDGDDAAFFEFAINFLNWSWGQTDEKEVKLYASQADLHDFSCVVLPQGLVSSGFFANLALQKFDSALKRKINHNIAPELHLHDASRYVDDLRIVLSAPFDVSLEQAQEAALQWLEQTLNDTAPGLTIAEEKTRTSAFRSDENPLLQQSKKMTRIQTAISGGFDPIGGGEVLDSVLALVRAQERLGNNDSIDETTQFMPVPDVGDATVDRFAAGKFRKTYRSLRPLLWETDKEQKLAGEDSSLSQFRGVRTRKELDDEARAFALSLIDKWIKDPSNVRLLRIALDLWPASELLEKILDLLRPFTEKGGQRKAPRRVAWYCLAEIFRAGATETGFVEDDEQLSNALDLHEYRKILGNEALRIVKAKSKSLPWYLRQQAYLFLASSLPADLKEMKAGKVNLIKPYQELIRFLLGEFEGLSTNNFAILAILARRSYLNEGNALELVTKGLTSARINKIATLDPNFAAEIIRQAQNHNWDIFPRVLADMGQSHIPETNICTLDRFVLNLETKELLRNEVSLLSFASKFMAAFSALSDESDYLPQETVFSPSEVTVTLSEQKGDLPHQVINVLLKPRHLAGKSLYEPPKWVENHDRWRFHLGFLLRFILTGQADFTRSVKNHHWKDDKDIYRAPGSHWYQRVYGLYNGHSAFDDDWLPVSEWTEQLLFGLLWWPGCAESFQAREIVGNIEETKAAVNARLKYLCEMQGSSVSLIPLKLPRLFTKTKERPMRACVVQTIIPDEQRFRSEEPTLSSSTTRTEHRRHLSAALAAVDRALALRETHKEREGLDWLILPELAVHPKDIWTHLVPFARAHRTIILAGLTYEELFEGRPLVNSAIWVLPKQDENHGLQMLIRRQGKKHLAPSEHELNEGGVIIQPFRPCQWLIGYQWSEDKNKDPLWLSAAVCYDATDINLAADLKNRSDIFAIPALNRDFQTFDNMSMALHYHMFQMVVVANNGKYGGSNAYAPYKDAWLRQVFHTHGQPQAAISFFELDCIASFKNRHLDTDNFKPVPAGDPPTAS
jgi:hypothetical protein